MHRSIQDVVRAIQRAPTKEQHWRRLRGNVWVDYCLWRTGLSAHAFDKTCLPLNAHGEPRRLIYKWLSGKSSPTFASAKTVTRPIPGSLWIFRMFDLFEDRPHSAHEVEAILKSCCSKADSSGAAGWLWSFPGEQEATAVMRRGDSTALVERGDLSGFLGIVALVREAEAKSDAEAHLALSMDMYRALPAAIRTPCVRRSAQLLKDCVSSIRARMTFSAIMFDVDWEVIDRQTMDSDYQPCRHLRRRQSTPPYRFAENDDPIIGRSAAT